MKNIFFITLLLSILFFVIFSLTANVYAQPMADKNPPEGVGHLRGRWDGVAETSSVGKKPFTLLIKNSVPDPKNANTLLLDGCMAQGNANVLAPIAGKAIREPNDRYNLTIWGTAVFLDGLEDFFATPVRLTGLVDILGPDVSNDSISNGQLLISGQSSSWSATHHDRRNPHCPDINIDHSPGLFINGDVYAAVQTDNQPNNFNTILEIITNIASFGAQVEMPGGNVQIIPPYTDIFSPNIDFIENFRYLIYLETPPQPDVPYKFILLNALGNPIAGTQSIDLWSSCTQGPPMNVSASLDPEGILASWLPVSPAPGFDPSANPSHGFYQIELYANTSEIVYGSSNIKTISHLLPLSLVSSWSPAVPDGINFGLPLQNLVDGEYRLEVIAFSQPDEGSLGSGHECQIRSTEERVMIQKIGNDFIILP